jgi:hypothetical protein
MRIKAAVFLPCLIVFISCAEDKTEWQGSVTIENGVTVVKNPVEPLYGDDSFELTEDLSIGVREGAPEYMFQSPRGVAVNDRGDIYVLDYRAREVKMYDKEGLYVRTIGRRGQGPGELHIPNFILWSAEDKLLVGGFNRLSYFEPDGTFVESTPMKGQFFVSDVDSAGNILGTAMANDKGVYEIRKYDPEVNELCSFGSSPFPNTAETGRRNPYFNLIRADVINGDQVVTGYPEEGYVLKIYDGEGTLLRRIEKAYVPLDIDQDELAARREAFPPEIKFDVPKHYPPFRWLMADDEGDLWVLTYEKTPDGEQDYMDVFDAEGRFRAKIPFKAIPLLIKNRKIYIAEEDEEGYPFIKRYSLIWKAGAGLE